MEQEIRTSQALHTYGPGAIADFPELSVMVLSHDKPQPPNGGEFWGEERENAPNRLDDERLAIAFNVECFVSPPVKESVSKASIQTTRFPTILQCPVTNELFNIRELESHEKFYTNYEERNRRTVDETFSGYHSPKVKGRKLIPVRFVIATEEGFLDDFPFDWYVHVKNNKPEEIGKGNRLFLKSKGNTASLKTLEIESFKPDGTFVCKASLESIFDQEKTFVDLTDPQKDYLQFISGRMPKPWLGRTVEKKESFGNSYKEFYRFPIDDVSWPPYNDGASDAAKRKTLAKYPRTLQRGAGNIYFPIIYKAISIPKRGYDPDLPEDFVSILQQVVRGLQNAKIISEEEPCENLLAMFDNIKDSFRILDYPDAHLKGLIQKYFQEETSKKGQYTIAQLREQEFRCFINPKVKPKRKEWYDSKIIDGDKYNFSASALISKVVLLNKLRELKIFRGFTRVKPLMFEDLIFESETNVTGERKREFQRIQDPRSDKNTATLPATEVKGEGIFIQFNDEILKKWEDLPQVKNRFEIIQNNYREYRRKFEMEEDSMLSARFIALHTFSHLLINELSIECGYGSSSLAEIVYCNQPEAEYSMNGILIYTSTSDSEGTLGGLVEKGLPDNLGSIIENAINKSKWCSSDPLCIDDEVGKGFMGVNLAACHSCCLLPETSCGSMNKFLDRGLVIGTLEDQSIGLFFQKEVFTT
ncbi:DUF1998 domain-containing protein [Salegentibacter salarius]|uniref:MrfA-like Zn-binding domain-containing protein n=1 Tax=Salegentibacter salarius TaxID=435906 RepID=A0A2N0TRG3_9FLAO|nr:DUF1998 domain-containing protein [Salegentibacter salarius]OEY71969.1 hypothetical protein BHS39_14725 [Salegentibacter salarius]PKD17325.1 hypothetical protein APR40_14695 [Salegentibacter salarius]SLK05610.1 protein of unknown function [Salegentibacter salarius]